MNYDVVVIGSGAAGLLAAISASRKGRRVLICEQMNVIAPKLLVTGNGKCNLTNILSMDEMIKMFGRQGKFMKPAFQLFYREELFKMLKKNGVSVLCNDGFHYFPKSNSALNVRDAFLKECEENLVTIKTNCKIIELVLDNNAISGVKTDSGIIECEKVIIATGGKSYRKCGGTGGGYKLATQAGHEITTLTPGLVGLVTAEEWPKVCTGLTLEKARLKINIPRHRGKSVCDTLLFTHHGISGPATIDISADVAQLLEKYEKIPLILELNDLTLEEWKQKILDWKQDAPKKKLINCLKTIMPAKMAKEMFKNIVEVNELVVGTLPNKTINKMSELLFRIPLTVTKTVGFDKAMVTRGGVRLKDVNPDTMESKLLQGLHFAGEVLDLDGPCGGYNLQWAFSSGFLAGESS